RDGGDLHRGGAHPLRKERRPDPARGCPDGEDHHHRGGPQGRAQGQEAGPAPPAERRGDRAPPYLLGASVQPLPHGAATAPSEIPLDLRYYFDILWRGRALIAAAAVAGLSLGLLAGFLQTPQYQAAALLQIEPPTPAFMSVSDALVGGGNYFQNADFYNTQFKILRSRGGAEAVVQRLKLGDRPPFKDNPDPPGRFLWYVDVDPVPESRLVRVL